MPYPELANPVGERYPALVISYGATGLALLLALCWWGTSASASPSPAPGTGDDPASAAPSPAPGTGDDPASAAPAAPASLRVDLLIVGPGDDLYARFGHAALLVRDGDWSRVYNFGYTDFRASRLVQDFLSGQVRFWLAVSSLQRTVREYRRQDRDLFLLPLNLDPSTHVQLAHALSWSALPANREYQYHHFRDNCSTRPRDFIDRAVGGALRQQIEARRLDRTLRDFVREGFAGRPAVLLLSELLLGRALDRPLDLWQGAFLPRLLQRAVRETTLAGEPLAGKPRALGLRLAPSPLDHDPSFALKLLWGLVLLVAGLGLALIYAARRRSRLAGLALALLTLLLGPPALLLWTLALYASLPELRQNELLLLLWPTDLLLLWPALRWLRGRLHAGRLLRTYAWLRLAAPGLAGVGHLTGLLYQQPRVWLVVALGLGAALVFGVRALPASPPVDSDRMAR